MTPTGTTSVAPKRRTWYPVILVVPARIRGYPSLVSLSKMGTCGLWIVRQACFTTFHPVRLWVRCQRGYTIPLDWATIMFVAFLLSLMPLPMSSTRSIWPVQSCAHIQPRDLAPLERHTTQRGTSTGSAIGSGMTSRRWIPTLVLSCIGSRFRKDHVLPVQDTMKGRTPYSTMVAMKCGPTGCLRPPVP